MKGERKMKMAATIKVPSVSRPKKLEKRGEVGGRESDETAPLFRLGRDRVEFERCCLTRRRGGAEKHAENIFSGLVSVLARLRRKVKTCERGDSGDRTASQRGSRWGGGLTNAARGLRLPTVPSGSGSRGVREMLLDAETRRRGETRGEHLFRIGFRACKATQESQNLRARRQRRSYGFAAKAHAGVEG